MDFETHTTGAFPFWLNSPGVPGLLVDFLPGISFTVTGSLAPSRQRSSLRKIWELPLFVVVDKVVGFSSQTKSGKCGRRSNFLRRGRTPGRCKMGLLPVESTSKWLLMSGLVPRNPFFSSRSAPDLQRCTPSVIKYVAAHCCSGSACSGQVFLNRSLRTAKDHAYRSRMLREKDVRGYSHQEGSGLPQRTEQKLFCPGDSQAQGGKVVPTRSASFFPRFWGTVGKICDPNGRMCSTSRNRRNPWLIWREVLDGVK